MGLPKTVDTPVGPLKVGGSYHLTLWHGDPEVRSGGEQVFPPRECLDAEIVAFEQEGDIRYEAKTADLTMGFLPEHVLAAKEA